MPSEARALAERCGWQNRIRFIGPVAEADLPALYAGATLFVFPSEYEGFGLPPLEAMASGVPVIGSNSSSLPEVIADAGLLVPPDDVPGWQAAIERVLADGEMRSEMHRRSLARAQQFSWERTAQLTAAVYESVLAR